MTIVTKLSEILKSSTHLSEMEEAITSLMRELTSALLSERLADLDKEMVQPYLSDGWEIDRIEERQLTFSFGTLIFKRRRLRKSGEKSFLAIKPIRFPKLESLYMVLQVHQWDNLRNGYRIFQLSEDNLTHTGRHF